MASVTVRGRFEEGKQVGLYPGGDFFSPGGKAIQTATVKDGEATFDKLDAGARFFAAQEVDGEWRHAAVTAKDPVPAKKRQSEKEIQAVLRSTLSAEHEGSGVITGARSTGNATLDTPTPEERAEAVIEQSSIPAAHKPSEGTPDPDHPKQADVKKGAQQRTRTPMGEAQVFDPNETSPPVKEESDLGREERERLEAEAKPKRKAPAKKAAPKAKASDAKKASRRKAASGRAKARRAKGG